MHRSLVSRHLALTMLLDEVAFYNAALTATQVRDHYNTLTTPPPRRRTHRLVGEAWEVSEPPPHLPNCPARAS